MLMDETVESITLKRPLWKRILFSKALYAMLAACLLGYFSLQWIHSLGGPEEFRRQFGWTAPLVTVPVQAIVAVSPFPSDLFCVGNGALYGFAFGTVLNWLGWWIAALIEFGLGRRAAKDFDIEAMRGKLPRWLGRFPFDSPAFLILSRQVLYIGGHVSTFVPGAAGVSWRRFSWCSAVAILPSSILMAGIGAGLISWGS